MTILPFCIARNHGWVEAKANVDKRETRDFAAMNRDPKQKRVYIAMYLRFSPSTLSTVVGEGKAVEANAFILDSKPKEARRAKHVGLNMKVYSWFKQHCSYVGHATKVLPFVGKCHVREQFFEHQKGTHFGQCGLDFTFS